MSGGTYNGHKNYQTWCASSWLDNDSHSYNFWRETALEAIRENDGDSHAATRYVEDALREHVEEEADSVIPGAGLIHELLQSAITDVDFWKIAEGYVEESMGQYLQEVAEAEEEEETEDEDDPVPVYP